MALTLTGNLSMENFREIIGDYLPIMLYWPPGMFHYFMACQIAISEPDKLNDNTWDLFYEDMKGNECSQTNR